MPDAAYWLIGIGIAVLLADFTVICTVLTIDKRRKVIRKWLFGFGIAVAVVGILPTIIGIICLILNIIQR